MPLYMVLTSLTQTQGLKLSDILNKLGFEQAGRHWLHAKLGEEDMVFVIGLEDIILDRMQACIHWTSTSDCEWGYRMFLRSFYKIGLIAAFNTRMVMVEAH